MITKLPENVHYVVVLRHATFNKVDGSISAEGIKAANSVGQQVLDKIPLKARDLPEKVLLVTSTLPRSLQTANVFVQELNVIGVELDELLPNKLHSTSHIARKIYESVTDATKVMIIMAHLPQVDLLPSIIVPEVCCPTQATRPGEGYFINRTDKTYEILKSSVKNIEMAVDCPA